jgi:hypothetical protein
MRPLAVIPQRHYDSSYQSSPDWSNNVIKSLPETHNTIARAEPTSGNMKMKSSHNMHVILIKWA